MNKDDLPPSGGVFSSSYSLPIQFEHSNQVEALSNPRFVSIVGNTLVFIPLPAQIAIELVTSDDDVTCARITHTAANGCVDSETVSVMVNPLPVVSLNDPADIGLEESAMPMLFTACLRM